MYKDGELCVALKRGLALIVFLAGRTSPMDHCWLDLPLSAGRVG